MKGTITLSLLLLVSTLLIAQTSSTNQQKDLDSLYAVWQDESQTDSIRCSAYKQYVWDGFLFSHTDSAFVLANALIDYSQEKQYPLAAGHAFHIQGVSTAIKHGSSQALGYFERALKAYQKVGDKRGTANMLLNIGTVFNEEGQRMQALDYFERALISFQEIGNKRGSAGSLNNIGGLYNNQGQRVRALDYYERALKISEELGDKEGVATTLINIGSIYLDQDNYVQALDYFERALKSYQKIENKRGVAHALNRIGVVYMNVDKRPQARDYFEQVINIYTEIGENRGIASALNNIGFAYMGQDSFQQALGYFLRSTEIHKQTEHRAGIAHTSGNIGFAYKELGEYNKAIQYCKRGLRIGEEIGNIGNQKKACQCLYDTYKSIGNGNEALAYLEKIIVFDDSLNSLETSNRLQQMEFVKTMIKDSLQDEQKRLKIQMAHDLEVVKKNKERNTLIGSGLLLLLLALGFFGRWQYVKKSRDTISKEKEKSDNLLLNILPAEIAEELKAKGEAQAKDFDSVSILFTDFKGFTQISESMNAMELVAELNYFFKAFDGICEKHQIEKIKTLGDSYMAAGGLPVPRADSVKNVVEAALEMTDFVIQRKKDREAAGQIPFEMRAGIHTGNVVAGIVGVKKFQYDIWGDTVNVASRMESHGDIGKVNISQATYELLKDKPGFIFQHRGKIRAKGKGEIDMYFVSKRLRLPQLYQN